MSCILLSRAIGGVFIDVVVTEDHEATMEIAEHPVERGTKVSDHAWRNPYVVTLTGAVDSPRAMASFESLLAAQRTAEPFDLVTGLRVYENMLIKELAADRDFEHARILSFTATLREIIIVNTQSGVGVGETTAGGDRTANPNATATDAATTTVSRGQIQAREVTASTVSQQSILERIATQ